MREGRNKIRRWGRTDDRFAVDRAERLHRESDKPKAQVSFQLARGPLTWRLCLALAIRVVLP